MFEANLSTIFDRAQKNAANNVSKSAGRGTAVILPALLAIKASPIAAIKSPIICFGFMDSCRNKKASSGVINAADCRVIEDNPAGIPICIA
ncbi:protein of unknown function [Acetoanaerobium sticklandii]|uniref:Uncharacterized protein n=1 Tax=Acetoanaerobium sticklandii (strain ATCC 12662 / DSM 519 / JCM 1433 / CCUG 9281 / NCIMB 10654 / HF) TaxID=499177 RepID=E3PXH2_ACESD|nr:protein of unknown function [Acetoanaerobium sticklandii]